jgi:tryptophan synthase alpha chain
MTCRIDSIFTKLRAEHRAALMPFITAGYPTLADTGPAILAMAEAGASMIEIGIPFSDPIADGPVIAAAMHEALSAGVTPRSVLEAVAAVRAKTSIGLIAMVSDSIVLRMGAARFIELAHEAGIDGLIVPDIDIESAAELGGRARERGMCLSLLVAPTSTPERMERIVSLSSGFVYLLARAGLTGERDAAPDVAEKVAMIRSMTDLPIAVGFGISRPSHVSAVTQHADAAIVGSSIVRAMGEAARRGDDAAKAAAQLVSELADGLRLGARAAHAGSQQG